eukprot:Rhum_TRINITY_DN15221_c6_g1::Rhum_TRINITY_DN15221_c6_g1_i4::g.143756::m.143756
MLTVDTCVGWKVACHLINTQLVAAQREEQPQPSPDRGSRGSKRHGSGSTGSDSGSKRRRVNDDADALLNKLTEQCNAFLAADMSAGVLDIQGEKLLQRACYETTLEWLAENEPKKIGEPGRTYQERLFPVGGTPGVGKTTFRLWVLARWLYAKKSQNPAGIDEWLAKFEAVCFFETDRQLFDVRLDAGSVKVGSSEYVVTPNVRTLLLVEWTRGMAEALTTEAQLSATKSVAIVTGSPGRFVKGSQAMKERWSSPPKYLPTWSSEELAEVVSFSADKLHEYGGVARLWLMGESQAKQKICQALAAAKSTDLPRMLGGFLAEGSHVHRVLDLDEDGKPTGFISRAVADTAIAQAVETAEHNIDDYVRRVVSAGGVFAKTYLGHLFEAFFSSAFGKAETALRYNGSAIKMDQGGDCVAFVESAHCKDNVLYKPEKRNFHGIDCFVLQGETVIMLQITVGKTHSPVSETHPDIKKLTKKFRNKKFVLVYVVPSKALAASFTVPQGNPTAWTVHVGHPESERFALYGDKLTDVPLPTDTQLKCQHCNKTETREGTSFASQSCLKTHERSCARTKT